MTQPRFKSVSSLNFLAVLGGSGISIFIFIAVSVWSAHLISPLFNQPNLVLVPVWTLFYVFLRLSSGSFGSLIYSKRFLALQRASS